MVFALPFADGFTLIGTTDQAFSGDPGDATASAEEIDYLCAAANGYFRAQIAPVDVIWTFAGVRSLYDDGSKNPQDTTRDYVLSLDEPDGKAPLLTIYGGKITTYRRLAEHALERMSHVVKAGAAWTKGSHLPGGDFPHDGLGALVAATKASWPFLADDQVQRMVRAYGTRVTRVLGGAKNLSDLGPDLGAGLTAAEVRYLMEQEWAQTADDVLWRRTKLGLRVTTQERDGIAGFMADGIRPARA